MTQNEINELKNIHNAIGRLLANAVGDTNPLPDEPQKAPDVPREHTASSMSDLVTPKQLGLIRYLAREAGVDADLECGFVMKCKPEDLSKKSASQFIDHLKEMAQKKGAAA
jgi:hypothetical protein